MSEQVSRRERLGRIALDTWDAVHPDKSDRELSQRVAHAVAAAVDEEYRPLLEACERVSEHLWAMDMDQWGQFLDDALAALRAAREESA